MTLKTKVIDTALQVHYRIMNSTAMA